MIKFLIRFLIIIFAGCIISLIILQNNLHIQKNIVTNLIEFLQKKWNAKIAVKSYKINFFTQSIYLEKGQVKPFKKTCYWNFEHSTIHISILDIIVECSKFQ
jgi:hypothetical protein